MSPFRFEAQQVWQGMITFTEVGVGTVAVAYRSPDSAAGKFREFWALKTGVRLSKEPLNTPMSLISVRTSTTYPSQMTDSNDGAGFKVYAATQLTGTLDFFKHDGESYQDGWIRTLRDGFAWPSYFLLSAFADAAERLIGH